MATNRTCERAFQLTRLFVFSCCALAAASGAAFAQTNSAANFRAPKIESSVKQGPVAPANVANPYAEQQRATQISAEQRVDGANKIAQVSATVRKSAVPKVSAKSAKIAKSAAIRQTQYSQSQPTAPYAQQGLPSVDLDEKYDDSCPDLSKMPSIMDIPYKIVPTPGEFPENCPLPDEDFHRKAPTPITFTWKASCLCYKPLYFEDVQLERYGHYCHPLLQPVVSRVRFWLTIPCLPYLMGVNPPKECIYDLGYYRPGNCAPSMIEPIPISLRGGLFEAGAIVGAVTALP